MASSAPVGNDPINPTTNEIKTPPPTIRSHISQTSNEVSSENPPSFNYPLGLTPKAGDAISKRYKEKMAIAAAADAIQYATQKQDQDIVNPESFPVIITILEFIDKKIEYLISNGDKIDLESINKLKETVRGLADGKHSYNYLEPLVKELHIRNKLPKSIYDVIFKDISEFKKNTHTIDKYKKNVLTREMLKKDKNIPKGLIEYILSNDF